ncbi:MAG: hypothetical protein ABSC72_05460 [Methylovirgula sp.]|jgi:hypothetical protein
MQRKRHLALILVGFFAVIAGLGEIIVGFRGNTLGILAHPLAPSMATAIVGAFYSLGGLFILTLRKWGAAIGVFFIGAEVLGRIYLVATGLAPSLGPDAVKIAIGGAIALALIAYVLSQWRALR